MERASTSRLVTAAFTLGLTALVALNPPRAIRAADQENGSRVVAADLANRFPDRYFHPTRALEGDCGGYRSPLVFDDGRRVKTPAEWQERKQEILATWQGIMGSWPPLIEQPEIVELERAERDGLEQRRVRIAIAPQDRTVDGYLLVPRRPGECPAVLVVYYDAETGVGLKGELRDFGYQLAQRGFVVLSIGTPDFLTLFRERFRYDPPGGDHRLQPLSALAYVAANCCNALANLPNVDARRIGIVGHSYGGKWAMFAACLYERFACAAWSDPGIVFDEARPNVNYWDPWYLGYDPVETRPAGLPAADRPRIGAYKRLIEAGHDLHELHALMVPRPFLVSGGSEDQEERWKALNHSAAVNRLLGYTNRVAMTCRPRHSPTEESNELLYRFFRRFLGADSP